MQTKKPRSVDVLRDFFIYANSKYDWLTSAELSFEGGGEIDATFLKLLRRQGVK